MGKASLSQNSRKELGGPLRREDFTWGEVSPSLRPGAHIFKVHLVPRRSSATPSWVTP